MFFSSCAEEAGGCNAGFEDAIKAQCFPFSQMLDISDDKFQSK